MFNFKGRNVLITGGSRGIGRATACAFAAAGASVGINYRSNDQAAEQCVRMLEGNDHQSFKYDVSDPAQAEKLMNAFIEKYKHIDILVNNAGISFFHPVEETNYQDWQKCWSEILNTNLIAAANLSYLAAKHMIQNKRGWIINVSSRGAFRGEPMQTAYGASKAGLNSFTQSLAKALGQHNIFVSAVAPGFTETDMGNETLTETERGKLLAETPLKRMAKAEEVAHAILFLASEGAEYSTGAIIDINGASYLRS